MIKEKIIKLTQQLENYISRQTLTRLAISVALIVFLVYVNSLFNGFVWDDEEQILNNQLIHHLGNWWRLFMGSTFNSGGGGLSGWYYKPLMPLTFMLSWFIWGGWAGGYHLFQLVLHLANVVLVMLLVFKLFQNKDRQKAKVIAFISALIWGVHSGISEAVFYLSAVQEVLFTFFILASLLVLLSEKMDDKKWLTYGVLIFLALLGKESALSGIAIGGLYLLFFRPKRLVKWLMVSSLVAVFYAWMRFGLAGVGLGSLRIIPIVKASLIERLTTLPYILFSYFRLAFWPKDLFISQHFVVREITDRRCWLSSLVLLGIVLGAWLAGRKKSRLYWFLWLWFGVGISLLLNLFPLDMSLAERWLYFPLIGLVTVVVWLMIERWFEVAIIGLAVVVSLLALRTWQRGYDWRNGLALYGHDIKLNPNAFDLNNNYGVALFRQGKVKPAAEYFRRSVKLAPDWWSNHNNLGVVLERQGQINAAEKEYRLAVKNGGYYLAYENLITLLFKQKRYQEVIKIGRKGLQVLPANFKLNYFTALAYYKLGNKELAELWARRLLTLYPHNPLGLNLLQLVGK